MAPHQSLLHMPAASPSHTMLLCASLTLKLTCLQGNRHTASSAVIAPSTCFRCALIHSLTNGVSLSIWMLAEGARYDGTQALMAFPSAQLFLRRTHVPKPSFSPPDGAAAAWLAAVKRHQSSDRFEMSECSRLLQAPARVERES